MSKQTKTITARIPLRPSIRAGRLGRPIVLECKLDRRRFLNGMGSIVLLRLELTKMRRHPPRQPVMISLWKKGMVLLSCLSRNLTVKAHREVIDVVG